MNTFHKLIRSFSFLQNILPKKLRLPFQYYVQKSIFALDPEFFVLKQLINHNETAIDIGANQGIYSYYLSKIAKKVVSFEPLEECCTYINNYGSNKITVINCALSNELSTLDLFIPIINDRIVYTRSSLKNPQSKHTKRTVPVRPLDKYSFENIGFIKIDVEGLEMSVLEGAVNTINKNKPNLLVEIDINQHSKETYLEVFNFLYNLDYQSFLVKNKKLVSCVGKELSEGQNYYNFIFIPKIKN